MCARFLDRADRRVAGVLENDTEPSEVIVRLRHGGRDLLRFGYIELQSQPGSAEFLLEVGNAFNGARGDRNLVHRKRRP